MTGLELKEIRKKFALSQEDVSNITSTSIRTVKSWEYGERNISKSAEKLLKGYCESQDKATHSGKNANTAFENLEINDKLNILYETIITNNKILNSKIEELEEKLRLSQLINRTYLRSLITSGKIKSEDLDSAKDLEINIDQKKQSSN